MREIKFRQVNPSGGFHYWGYVDDERTFTSPIYGNSEQYTGLKDKNGKEVYEYNRFQMCESGNIYIVVMKFGAFGYISRSGDFIPMHHLIQNKIDFEIIGTIHD
jgi:hypothetical protein